MVQRRGDAGFVAGFVASLSGGNGDETSLWFIGRNLLPTVSNLDFRSPFSSEQFVFISSV